MARRRKFQSKKDGPPDPFAMIIADAVESAAEAADEAGADIRRIINGKSGLGAVFTAAMDAVADTEPGNMGRSVFDAAMRAAAGAVDSSAISSGYDRVRLSVQSIPDRLVRAAGQWAASDLFADISIQDKSGDGGRLLDRMKVAAVQAAKTRLEQDDAATTVQAAAADTQVIANIASGSTSQMVMIGAPVHAAAVAVFEVAIRGVPPDDLADAIKEVCNDLPEMARRHDDLIVNLVAALSIVIAGDTIYRRKYQTAVRGAEKISRNEAADRIVDEIVGNTFEAVYMALVSSAYANSDRSAFESCHDEALAAACGVDIDHNKQRLNMLTADLQLAAACGVDMDHNQRMVAGMMAASGISPGGNEEAYPDLQQNLAEIMGVLLSDEEDPARRKMFMNAMDVDYKAAVSSGQIDGIISLYDMAYRAGYEGAGAVVGEKSIAARTGPQ